MNTRSTKNSLALPWPDGTADGVDHVVVQGECLSSIAHKYGHTWETLWNHPRNSGLRQFRKDPNILFSGDCVYIAPREVRLVPVSTDHQHCFVKKGIPAKLRLRFATEETPRIGERYVLTTSEGMVYVGTLDSEGKLEESISPDAKWAQVLIGTGSSTSVYHFRLGHMDPITKGSGVQKRLMNLGRLPKSDSLEDIRVEEAIIKFQESQHLEKTGDIDDSTCAALQRMHGG